MKTKKPEDWEAYKTQRNLVTKQLRKVKKDCISARLTESNPEKMGENAKCHIGWGNPGSPSQIIHNGVLKTKQSEVADAMNEILTDKIKNVKDRILRVNKDPLDYTRKYLEGKNVGTFQLGRVTREEVRRVIKGMKNTNASGPDEIPAIVVKKLSGFLSLYLTHIINLCFDQGCFPNCWRLVKIIPLYKLQDEKDQNQKYLGTNYRPVANLNAKKFFGSE